MVAATRAIETLLGREEKTVQAAEAAAQGRMRRSLAVRSAVPAGAVLTEDVLIVLRPSYGWPVRDAAALVGRRLARSLAAGDLIMPDDLMPEVERAFA